MQPMAVGERVAWDAAGLAADRGWIFTLDDRARRDLISAVRKVADPDRPLFDFGRNEFDLGSALPVLRAAFAEQRNGTGLALVRGLPREGVTEAEFRLMTWAIGLHFGVARPQGKASQYLSAVRNEGTDYRSAGGRGYSSNAKLDFHVDGCDVVGLACYNVAKSGGMSLCTSSIAVHNLLARERPDLLELLYEPFCFSRQNEQAPDEGPYVRCPIYGVAEGVLFGRWNRNRAASAQKLEGVAPWTPRQAEALDLLDALLQRPDLMYSMWLEPGDLQLMNNHTALHSRTQFEDWEEPERRRVLYRLWLAPPDSRRLPPGWEDPFKTVEPGAVRGGIRGFRWDDTCRAFEARQAATLGMTVPG
ncbi:TauD/TfdA family dioxygenase [Siccirubricoccus deserti]|uniref:TauD/TfdA family dioxygenase n=1 Tax=Siccirubricoccus deserti TaxID=2013562 RepID=A0A9X0QZD2_9PROT|nr:TauD/TfdA family dioxygenase [Siccirubricoccus deserti]MBC4016455.1 TauD/TfdA family dioxygenase [Siccirubricoccus deserti]